MRIPVTITALVSPLLLAACGGGSGAPAGAQSPAPAVQPGPAPVIAAATVGGEANIEIGNLNLVGSTRISRTVFEYSYTVDVSNWSDAPANITATLASSAAATVVVDGAVSFGDVARGGTVVSADTFTIRHDRAFPFDPGALSWTVQVSALAPTTFELIDQALATGAINAETALVYKVFHEFRDESLPVEYRGREDGTREASAVSDAIESFASLSPATQDLLRPFLLPPDDPASWYQLRLAQPPAPAGGPRIAAAAPGPSPASVGPVEEVPGFNGLIKRILVTVGTSRIHVYWNDSRAGDRAIAELIAHEIDLTIWTKLTGLLGTPPLDASGVLQVRIEDIQAMTLFYSQDVQHTLGLATNRCGGGVPTVYLDRNDLSEIAQTAAHEIAHAIQARFALASSCAETAWLAEATATWVEHYIYPNNANTEHDYAPYFLNDTAVRLETRGNQHEYGAYLWFLYATGGDTSTGPASKAQVVPATWGLLATNNSLGAVDAAINGLSGKWPEFALYNWNRVVRRTNIDLAAGTTRMVGEPYVYYGQWDGLRHSARESTTAAPATGQQPPKKVHLEGTTFKGYPLPHRIEHLGAKYWHFDFRDDPNIRRVRVTHPYFDGSEPTAKVQVIVKRRNQPWEPATDWTSYERRTLCRDKPLEDFEALVVVISNSEVQNRNHVLRDDGTGAGGGPAPFRTFVEVSAFGCTNWEGSVQFSTTSSGSGSLALNETAEATNLRLVKDFDRFTHLGYDLESGTVSWHHIGSYTASDGDSCAGESRGAYDLANSITGIEWIADFGGCCGFTPPVIPAYNLRGNRFLTDPPDDYLCHNAQEPFEDYYADPIQGHNGFWLDFGQQFISIFSPTLYDSDPFGNELAGSSVVIEMTTGPDGQEYRKSRSYSWLFRKAEPFDGEPER